MHVIHAQDVGSAYRQGLELLLSPDAIVQSSRAGEVRSWPEPVVTKTSLPDRCVLLDRNRRANPFFHMYEALWMLSGHDDATLLDRFVGDFSERFAESDGRQWGAYGHRWRRHFDMDQLERITCRLRNNHEDRRIVLSMWDPDHDLIEYGRTEPRDVPCNTHVYFRIVSGCLQTTVCCRSNDAVWGAHGANAVHFSFLHQYVAAAVGVGIGPMYQVSNNYHMYTATTKVPEASPLTPDWDSMMRTIQNPDLFLRSAERLVQGEISGLSDQWIRTVAAPMLEAHDQHRLGGEPRTENIACPVWRQAAEQWINR